MGKTLIDINKALEAAIKAATSHQTAFLIGGRLTKQIKKRTRVGKGVDTFAGKQTKLKIKDKTKQNRKRLKRKGELSKDTTPKKANLTRSGKMLDSLHTKYDFASTVITIEVDKDQQDKVDNLDKKGHKFLNLTRGEFRELLEIMAQQIVSVLRRKLKG